MEKPLKIKVDVISRLRLESETASWIKRVPGENSNRNSNTASQAVEFFYWYCAYRKGFLINLIENHYEEIKHLLRKIGRAKNEMPGL